VSKSQCCCTIVLTVCALRASRQLHGRVLGRLLAAPLAFFDARPSGEIINRLLGDMQGADSSVPGCLGAAVNKVLYITAQAAIIVTLSPWAGLCFPLVAWACVRVFARVRPATRDSKRLEKVTANATT
jgi:ABC-type multidrug transport system fused ATPase/permease subunit